jgi:ATPase subunit of ABC transporter with duplicated ATPase domains
MKEAEARQREAEEQQRAAAREAAAAQDAAEKEAERLAREQSKTEKERERETKKAAAAAAKAAKKVEKHREEVAGEAKPHRKTRLDRRYDRQTAALGLLEGETVTIMADGRSGLRRATMFITRYRVAIVLRSRRSSRVRWIPLEEVTTIDTAWRGAPTMIVNAPIEVLPFKQRARATIQQLYQLVTSEVREARSGGARRHSADLMQDWTDRTNDMLDSNAGRFRLWIRRHPWFTVLWLASLIPVAYLITRSRL